MSDALYPTRLRWDGRKGVAKRDGVVLALTSPPDIGLIIRWDEIDYAPGVVAQIRPRHGAMRDMRPEEVQMCREYLAGVK